MGWAEGLFSFLIKMIRQGQAEDGTLNLFRLEVTLVENPWWLQVIIVNTVTMNS